jgi:hypothetical protein
METATNPQLPRRPAATATALDNDDNSNNDDKKAYDDMATARKWPAALPRSDAGMTGMSSLSYPLCADVAHVAYNGGHSTILLPPPPPLPSPPIHILIVVVIVVVVPPPPTPLLLLLL